MEHRYIAGASAALCLLVASGCGSGNSDIALPQLTAATAKDINAGACAAALTTFSFANTRLTSATVVAPGGVTVASVAAASPEHCLVKGVMNERVSTVDGASYAIGFEMRLPTNWNGRFFYQANGGIDGSVVTAVGNMLGGAPVSTALHNGFAVISSDAGHSSPAPFWGRDPQARLDYGYNAVGTLTPMAKGLIKYAYGKEPDRSYLAGCSNGGRHAMVAASRYADQYDGILAGNPGFNLPKAAVAQLYGVQQYASIASNGSSGTLDISTAVTATEWALVSSKLLAKCDALDGVADGIVSDTKACQGTFNLATDVPTCTGARDGTCLTAAQKTVIGNIFAGAKNTAGTALYSSFPFDPGIAAANFRTWEYTNSVNLDPGAVAFIFTSPPSTVAAFTSGTGLQYAQNFSMDNDAPKIFATDATYSVAPMVFMTPPSPSDMGALRNRGAKLMVFHGIADGVFSPDDTARWWDSLNTTWGGQAKQFARYYPVPGMNHCSGGYATDQFDMVTALVNWVETGAVPERVIAKARGTGANVVNAELPAGWSATRTRPLCPYPSVAKYTGANVESADSFSCQ